MVTFDSDYWALIIGGSSGFGLATAQKLARHGMNICIVHRDRRGAMARIQPSFDALRKTGVDVATFNIDALSAAGRTAVLDGLTPQLGEAGKIRLVLHSVAFGNLKLLAPYTPSQRTREARQKIAQDLNITPDVFDQTLENAFEEGADALYPLVDPPVYSNDFFLDEEDFARTTQAMGSNSAEWVQDLHRRQLFTDDARAISLTSEGNRVAWRGYAAVSAAKAVLESVSRAMAIEFAPFGIRSNIIQAGVTDTAALKIIPGSSHIKANARLRNPFGRLTQPEDVANVIYLLCMDEAAWVNGALICVDGGERLG
jgi:NAD(P)-dependent dehydrogenase (short-subunit alcohol dehydrogenase family)